MPHTLSVLPGRWQGSRVEHVMLCFVSVLLGDGAAVGAGDRTEKPPSGPELK